MGAAQPTVGWWGVGRFVAANVHLSRQVVRGGHPTISVVSGFHTFLFDSLFNDSLEALAELY